MFKKPPNVKNISALRSSDRKKIIQQIVQSYSLDHLDPAARNSLLPDGAQSAKFTTHLDEPGVIYYDQQGIQPLWIRIVPPGRRDDVLIPTVYSLWNLPDMLKTVSTPEVVLQNLQKGADLMTPGLRGWDTEIKLGDITAIALDEGVPIAVGVAAFDIGKLSKAGGEKGKAVYLVHCYKDELWAMGAKQDPPQRERLLAESHLEEATEHLSLEPHSNGQINETEQPIVPTDSSESEKISMAQSQGNAVDPSVSEIDAAFKKAALYGLYDLKVSEKQSTISLPLTSSTFVSSHLNPYLPRSFAQYNFKKTSWKKAATFLKKYMEKEGIMKTKDRGGETVIITINWTHKLINEFEAYDLDPRELDKGTNDTGTTPTVAQPAQIRELFKPGKVLKNILESQAKSTNDLYNASQIREALNQFLVANPNLVNSRNPRLIRIDYNLQPLLKQDEANLEYLARDKLVERLLDSSSPHYTIDTGGKVETRKGKPPKIHIVLETRQGRKTVTRFWGLEAFFLNPNEIAEELRNTCATSASVGALLSASPKQPIMEVMVQGPLADAVVDALQKRGVKKSFIVIEDKRK